MKFTDKLFPFSIDNILESTHLCSNHSFSLCHTNLIHHRRCRRTRTVFSDTQLIGLEKRFETQKYLSTPDRIEFANLLNLTQSQVKTWYQNRRMKWKKQILQEGYQEIPTKSKGRPKKNSIPSYAELQKLQNEKQLISAPCTSDNESISHSEEFIDIEQ